MAATTIEKVPALWRLGACALAGLLAAGVVARGNSPPPSTSATAAAPEEEPIGVELPLKGLLNDVEDDRPMADAQDRPFELKAYESVLRHARRVPAEELAKHARTDITFGHMFGPNRAEYRGEVVHLEGRLKRVRKLLAPRALRQEGLPNIYEGWLFPEIYFGNPCCILFTDLPAGVPVAEEMEEWARFDGYYFKLYRYQAADAWRKAPLLIGRTVAPMPTPSQTSGLSEAFVMAACILIAVLVGGALGLTWWFRRGDRRIQERLRAAEIARNPFAET